MKKIIPILLVLMISLIPLGSVFAYSGGLLHGQLINRSDGVFVIKDGVPTSVTDGNETTGTAVTASGTNYSTLWYTFSKSFDITNYQIKANALSSEIRLIFYDEKGVIIRSLNPVITGTKTAINVKGVRTVSVENLSSSTKTVYDMDVFGTEAVVPFDNGLLNGKILKIGSSIGVLGTGYNVTGVPPNSTQTNNSITQITDGDLSTQIIVYPTTSSNNNVFWHEFSKAMDIDGYQFSSTVSMKIVFKYADGSTDQITGDSSGKITIPVKKNVIGVGLGYPASAGYVKEFGVFGKESVVEKGLLSGKTMFNGSVIGDKSGSSSKVTDGDLNTNISLSSNRVSWYEFDSLQKIDKYMLASDDINATTVRFYGANQESLRVISSPIKTGVITTITPVENVKYVEVRNAHGSSYLNLKEFDVYGSAKVVIHDDITSLFYTNTYNSVDLAWNIPTANEGFNGSKVYRNGVLIDTLDKSTSIYKDLTVDPSSSYTYKVTAIYSDGYETTGISKEVKTDAEPKPLEPVGEVKSVKVDEKYNQVNLSWKLPTQENFKSVIIYRDVVQKISMIETIIFGSSAYAASTPIFETNGTYFNDLSVKPETKYEYTLKTLSTEDIYSAGVTVAATTPKAPLPTIEDGKFEEAPNGDFVYSWSAPTTGKVKILIDGKEFKTVNASDKTITIPKENMKLDILGKPNVSLVPISEDGTSGEAAKPTNPSDVDVPFSAVELLSTSAGLLWIVGPFVLLALAFLVVPKLRRTLFAAFRKNPDSKEQQGRRFQVDEKERKSGVSTSIQSKEPRATREPRISKRDLIVKQERTQREPRQLRERTRQGRTPRVGRRT